MILTEENIQTLLEQASRAVDRMDIYKECLEKLDIEAIISANKERPLTFEEIGANFSYCGFLVGIEYALRNLNINDDGKDAVG